LIAPNPSGGGNPNRQEPSTTRLRGQLGLVGIAFMVIAGAAPLTVVGGPVPIAFANGNGAGVPMMFILTGVVLVFFAVGFTAMSRFVPAAGAFYSYVFVGIGRRMGIGTGYAALLSYFTLYLGVFGLLGPAIGAVVTSFHGPHLPWWLWSAVSVVAVAVIGYRNVAFSGRILGILLTAEILVTLALALAIVFTNAHGRGLSTDFADPAIIFSGAPGVAFLFAVLGFIGFEATVVFRDEARDPVRTVPRATYVAITFIGAFYALTSWAMVSAIGDADVVAVSAAAPDAVLPDLTVQYLGQAGESLVRVLFATSIFACVLTFHNVVARYLFSLANRGLMPARLARVHPQFDSPHVAGVIVGVVAFAFIAAAALINLDPVTQFYTWLVGLASLGYVVLLVVASLAVLAFFARNPSIRLNVWQTRIAPAIGLIGLIATLAIIMMNLSMLVGGDTAVAIGIVVLLVAAFALGPILGTLRPQSGWEPAATEPQTGLNYDPAPCVGVDPPVGQ
jgi:amino acid transporter